MRRLPILIALSVAGFVGCSGDDEEAREAGQSPANLAANESPKAPSHPAALAAEEFLSAVIEGDTSTASNRLTPRAIEQFRSTGKRFAPPGLESATFRIGEVREPSKNQALVQCLLSNPEAEGGAQAEEMCCMMRLVGQDWRVSGIAYDAGGAQPFILDFENLGTEQSALPQQVVERPIPGSGAPRTALPPAANPTR